MRHAQRVREQSVAGQRRRVESSHQHLSQFRCLGGGQRVEHGHRELEQLTQHVVIPLSGVDIRQRQHRAGTTTVIPTSIADHTSAWAYGWTRAHAATA